MASFEYGPLPDSIDFNLGWYYFIHSFIDIPLMFLDDYFHKSCGFHGQLSLFVFPDAMVPLRLCITLVCVSIIRYVMNANAMLATLVNDLPFTNSHPLIPVSEYFLLFTIPEPGAFSFSSGYMLIFPFYKPSLILPVQHESWMSHTPSSRLQTSGTISRFMISCIR